MRKVLAAVLAGIMFLFGRCENRELPRKIPESGLIVDVMQFREMSQAEIREIAGKPIEEPACIMPDPVTGEMDRNGRGVMLKYQTKRIGGELGYSFIIDKETDTVVGCCVVFQHNPIPFDGESFEELLVRFGVEMADHAQIERRIEEPWEIWRIEDASELGYSVALVGYDEEDKTFLSFHIMYEEAYYRGFFGENGRGEPVV